MLLKINSGHSENSTHNDHKAKSGHYLLFNCNNQTQIKFKFQIGENPWLQNMSLGILQINIHATSNLWIDKIKISNVTS